MLWLDRRERSGVKLTLPGGQVIEIYVREARRGKASLGFEAPREIVIDRTEWRAPDNGDGDGR